jgi:hypothetical protein
MAPGPHVELTDKGAFLRDSRVRELDAVQELDEEYRGYRYYQSEKVLGKLYRQVDENKFFTQIHESEPGHNGTLLNALRQRIVSQLPLVQWKQHIEEAWDIREW